MGLIAKLHTTGQKGMSFAGFLGPAAAWMEFAGWADRLEHPKHGKTVALAEHLYQTDLPGLEADLQQAVKEHPPRGPAGEVAEELLRILKERGDATMIAVQDEVTEVPDAPETSEEGEELRQSEQQPCDDEAVGHPDAEEYAMDAWEHASVAQEALFSAAQAMDKAKWEKATVKLERVRAKLERARHSLRLAEEEQKVRPLDKTAEWVEKALTEITGTERILPLLDKAATAMNAAAARSSTEVAALAVELGGDTLQQLMSEAQESAKNARREPAIRAISLIFQLESATSGLLSSAKKLWKQDQHPDAKKLLRKGRAIVDDTMDLVSSLQEALEEKKEPVRITQEELSKLLNEPGALTLADADLSGFDLANSDLTKGDLTGAKLVGAKLSHSSLYQAWLDRADLRDAELIETEMTEASLVGANLQGAKLAGCNLTKADLRGADLTNADLTRARLTGANLAKATLDEVQKEYARSQGATV